MEITAGEYGYDLFYFRRMLEAGRGRCPSGATRCGGITGFLGAGTLCAARSIDLSAHTAPSLHAHACCGVVRARHIECFRDHVAIEDKLFDGVLSPVEGMLRQDRSRPGFGLSFRWQDAEPFLVYDSRRS